MKKTILYLCGLTAFATAYANAATITFDIAGGNILSDGVDIGDFTLTTTNFTGSTISNALVTDGIYIGAGGAGGTSPIAIGGTSTFTFTVTSLDAPYSLVSVGLRSTSLIGDAEVNTNDPGQGFNVGNPGSDVSFSFSETVAFSVGTPNIALPVGDPSSGTLTAGDDITFLTGPSGNYQDDSLSVVFDGAAVGSAFTTSIASTGNSAGEAFIISAVIVPEPSSAALLGLGGLALIIRRKRA